MRNVWLACWALLVFLVPLGCTIALCQTALPPVAPTEKSAKASPDHLLLTDLLKGLTDPTILRNRVWLETEWDKYKGGVHRVEQTLGGLWAWSVSTNQDVGLRLKLPYEWHFAGDGPGDSDRHGLGDLKLGTGTAFRFDHSWRATAGLELRMPTAADNLGDNDWRLQELGGVAWDITRWLTLSPSAEYNQSVAEIHGARPKHYLETYFPVTFLLPDHWSVTARYETKVDFENDNFVTQSAKVWVARQFKNPPLNLSLALKKPFDGGQKEFQVNFIISYYFR